MMVEGSNEIGVLNAIQNRPVVLVSELPDRIGAIKGQIEVTRVDERLATARVLKETDANDPLLTGDFIKSRMSQDDDGFEPSSMF